MAGVTPERIRVSEHAAERWIERVEGKPLPKDGKPRYDLMNVANVQIKVEVTEAIRNGRKAKRKPRWACATDFRPRMNAPANNMRYAWNATESICFSIRRQGLGWFVLTIVTKDTK